MTGYIIGLIGMWIFTDGWFSIVTTCRFNPQKVNSWMFDHSIRIIRMAIGIVLMILGAMV